MAKKGAALEEVVRAYFARQGFFALRGVSLRFEDEEVTDLDVWLYGRPAAGARLRAIVDVKAKRSPKAFERILWTRGMQLALGCDRAIVATTDGNPKVARFAQQQRVSLLTRNFLERLEKGISLAGRLTWEEFLQNIGSYTSHKQDGDWIKRIEDSKSALLSSNSFSALNKAMSGFGFFAERAETRPQQKEQALRAAFLCASVACVALDAALERLVYEDGQARYNGIVEGITFGDAGDGRVKSSIDTVLSVLAAGMENGKVVAAQARSSLNKLFGSVRAEIVAEHFSREHNAQSLFAVGRELEERAHANNRQDIQSISTEAKAIVGVFADYVQAKRSALFNGSGFAAAEVVRPALPAAQQGSGFAEPGNPGEGGSQGEIASGHQGAPKLL